jgi:HPr kinase/phosphorylase
MAARKNPQRSLHGVLIDILGVGVLILGESGIGKSECALELVLRGHRLVADDLIEIRREDDGALHGFSSELGRHHMEIKGLGLIDLEKLFGIAATRDRATIDLVVEFVERDEPITDRVGLEDRTYILLGTEIPHKRIPVRSGRNLAAITEVAARDYLLKKTGYHVAREFDERLNEVLRTKD